MSITGLRPLPGLVLGALLLGLASQVSASVTIAYPQYLWPKVNGVATVYYLIDPQVDASAQANIAAAIQIFNADFPGVIQWTGWKATLGANYVYISLNSGDTSGVCEAEEGYAAIPKQPMGGSATCTVGTLLHEMGHVVGLWHEQSRADRNTYVTVNYTNVIKGSWGNFQLVGDDEQVLGPYDYASVMQYIPYAFSRNGLPVIETKPAGIPLAGYEGVPSLIGQGGAPSQPAFDYSAGDKEAIRRLYGAAPTQVTVTSNPAGLSVIVDGVTVTTPHTYAWPLYSTHTLGASADVQTLQGYILNSSNPAQPASFYYRFGRWSNSTATSNWPSSQTITVVPGTGSATFPSTAPLVATYSANFIQLVPYTAAAIWPPVSPAPGTASVSPQPLAYTGVAGEFFVARQQVALTATAATGWNFYEFNNAPYWLPGGLGANPRTFDVRDTGNPVDPTAEFSSTPVYTVTLSPETFSSGLFAYVDSGFVYTPKNFSAGSADYPLDTTWTPGSSHTLAILAEQYPYSVNSYTKFSKWSDGGAISHTIASLPATATTYKASVTSEYQPATNFSYPPCGGTAEITPASTNAGFYASGTALEFTASPAPGWTFGGWSYDLTGVTNPDKLTASGETLVFANFNTVAAPLALTALKPAAVPAGSKAFVLTLTGTGFDASNSHVAVNGLYRTVTYVSPTTLTVPLTAADAATPGALQVFVENYPAGSTGCAVFGYQTLLVTGSGSPLAAPTFVPTAGSYVGTQSVTLSDALAAATIHYTTNGTTPTSSSPKYTGPITVAASETVKAIAVASGYLTSPVAAASYVVTP
jgi:hypothetical protein